MITEGRRGGLADGRGVGEPPAPPAGAKGDVVPLVAPGTVVLVLGRPGEQVAPEVVLVAPGTVMFAEGAPGIVVFAEGVAKVPLMVREGCLRVPSTKRDGLLFCCCSSLEAVVRVCKQQRDITSAKSMLLR